MAVASCWEAASIVTTRVRGLVRCLMRMRNGTRSGLSGPGVADDRRLGAGLGPSVGRGLGRGLAALSGPFARGEREVALGRLREHEAEQMDDLARLALARPADVPDERLDVEVAEAGRGHVDEGGLAVLGALRDANRESALRYVDHRPRGPLAVPVLDVAGEATLDPPALPALVALAFRHVRVLPRPVPLQMTVGSGAHGGPGDAVLSAGRTPILIPIVIPRDFVRPRATPPGRRARFIDNRAAGVRSRPEGGAGALRPTHRRVAARRPTQDGSADDAKIRRSRIAARSSIRDGGLGSSDAAKGPAKPDRSQELDPRRRSRVE